MGNDAGPRQAPDSASLQQWRMVARAGFETAPLRPRSSRAVSFRPVSYSKLTAFVQSRGPWWHRSPTRWPANVSVTE